jgi:hypothetical protein
LRIQLHEYLESCPMLARENARALALTFQDHLLVTDDDERGWHLCERLRGCENRGGERVLGGGRIHAAQVVEHHLKRAFALLTLLAGVEYRVSL